MQRTCHRSLFKQRTSTEGWNKGENEGNESSLSFASFLSCMNFSHIRKTERRLELMEYMEVK